MLLMTGCNVKARVLYVFYSTFCLQLAGAVLLGIGIWFLVDENALKYLHIANVGTSDNLVRAASITITTVGSVVFLTGFLGCCGAIRESPCMLTTVCLITLYYSTFQGWSK